jgi:hypothetical protein
LGFPCRRCERGRQSAELVVGGMETPNFRVAARRKTSPGLRNLGFPRPPAPPRENTLGKLGFPFRGARRRAAPEPGKLGVSISRHTAEGRARARETWGFHVPPPDENRGFPCFYAALETWGFHDDGNRRPSLGNWWCFETADPSLWELRVFSSHVAAHTNPLPFRHTTDSRPNLEKLGVSISWHGGKFPQVWETWGSHVPPRWKPQPQHGVLGGSMPQRDRNRRPSMGNFEFPCHGATETATRVPRSSGVPIFCGATDTTQFRETRGFPRPATTETVASVRGARVSMSRHDGEPPKPAELWGFCFVARGKPPSSGNLAVSISRPDENRAPGEGNLGFHVAARP